MRADPRNPRHLPYRRGQCTGADAASPGHGAEFGCLRGIAAPGHHLPQPRGHARELDCAAGVSAVLRIQASGQRRRQHPGACHHHRGRPLLAALYISRRLLAAASAFSGGTLARLLRRRLRRIRAAGPTIGNARDGGLSRGFAGLHGRRCGDSDHVRRGQDRISQAGGARAEGPITPTRSSPAASTLRRKPRARRRAPR